MNATTQQQWHESSKSIYKPMYYYIDKKLVVQESTVQQLTMGYISTLTNNILTIHHCNPLSNPMSSASIGTKLSPGTKDLTPFEPLLSHHNNHRPGLFRTHALRRSIQTQSPTPRPHSLPTTLNSFHLNTSHQSYTLTWEKRLLLIKA